MKAIQRLVRVAAIAGTVSCLPSVTQGQTFRCVSENSIQVTALRNAIVAMVTAPANSELDSLRIRYQLPAGAANSVVYQKTKSFCGQVGQAYHNAVDTGSPQVSRDMIIFKVGSNRYVALDPAFKFGEFQVNVVFDQAVNKLFSFTG